MRVALGFLDVEKTLGARAAGLVDDDHGLLHQLVLGDDALDEPRHLVGTTAGSGRNDEFHRFRGLPGRKRLNRCGRPRGEQRKRRGLAPGTIGKVAHFTPPIAAHQVGTHRGNYRYKFSVTTLTEVKLRAALGAFRFSAGEPLPKHNDEESSRQPGSKADSLLTHCIVAVTIPAAL